MGSHRSTLIAIGGGDLASSPSLLKLLKDRIERRKCRRMVIMTVATEEPTAAARKYQRLFKDLGVKETRSIGIVSRDDGFDEKAIEAMEQADAMYFTGGDQLNITSLMGGTPVHEVLRRKWKEGTLIAGSSAGAAMMSGSMIISGESDSPPRSGGVEIAPGVNLLDGVLVDTHFSERGRHGRLLTAVAHYPQLIGVGIDTNTAAIFCNGSFRVAGEGVVTVMDGSQMHHCDLPNRKKNETVGLFGVRIHVLPAGYSFEIEPREPHFNKALMKQKAVSG
jgi:cyanophycinase